MDVIVHVVIRGRVQGIGYRAWTDDEAHARGIAGWVRNRRDGTVEAVVQGPPAAVDAIVAWARRGPEAAHVERLDVAEAPGEGALGAFEKRPTA